MRFTAGAAFLLFASFVLLADDHSVDFDAHTDFSKIKTFTIREGKISSRKPELDNALFARNLVEVIRTRLRSKGLNETAEHPDIVVSYRVDGLDFSTVERGQDVRIPDVPGQRGTVIRGAGPHPVRYSEGTLTIDLTTGTGGALVWRGVYREKENDSTKVAQKLPDDAKKLLDSYPPAKNRKPAAGSETALKSQPAGPATVSHLHLNATQDALTAALKSLEKAVPFDKGGYLEKAEADVRLAIQHILEADYFIDDQPNSAEPPMAAVAAPDFNIPASELGRNPRMDEALGSLHKAFDELGQVPGGSLGGSRTKSYEDIAVAARDVLAGINFAGNRGRGSSGNVPPADSR